MSDTTLWARDLTTGWTDLYFRAWDEAGNVWQTTTSSYVPMVIANLANYRLVATESPAGSGRYSVAFPPGSAPKTYTWAAYKGAGTTADVRWAGPASGYWDGTTFGNSPAAVATVATLAGYDQLIDSGTVADPSPTPTTFIGSSNLSADSNVYRTLSVCFTGGDLAAAKSTITSYNGDTKRFVVSGFSKAPANGDPFKLI